jgi:hypothetical protein
LVNFSLSLAGERDVLGGLVSKRAVYKRREEKGREERREEIRERRRTG